MATSQNGWPVLSSGHRLLRKIEIPGAGGQHVITRQGSAGFLLGHVATYFDHEVERLDIDKVWDEWGHAVRPIRGQTSGYSNHASGTAVDLNATRHPRGVSVHRGFTHRQIKAIENRLPMYRGCIVWGGKWRTPDGMHFEIGENLATCERNARRLMRTKIGKAVLEANPGLRKEILS